MESLHPLHATPREPLRFGVGRGFYTGQGTLRGVTTTIRSLFTPNYRASEARGPMVPMVPGPPEEAKASAAPQGPRGGLRRGKQVDRQFTRVVRLLGQTGLDLAAFLKPGRMPPSVTPNTAARVALQRMRGDHPQTKLHPFTFRVLEFLARKQLRPIDAQVMVGCYFPLRLGTAVDIVCLDARDRVWLLEIKTGYHRNYHHSCGAMEPPFRAFDDSPYHQHQLQMLLTLELYRHTFPQHNVAGAAVIRVSPSGTYVYPLRPEFRARADACLATVNASLRR